MNKSSWTRLNKLFKIDQVEWKFSILLIEKNLKSLLEHLRSFFILVFPRLAPLILIPSKHFVLKDFLFYKVVRFTNIEAGQTCLDKCEKKCYEGTLHQAVASTSCPILSPIPWLAKTKPAPHLVEKSKKKKQQTQVTISDKAIVSDDIEHREAPSTFFRL